MSSVAQIFLVCGVWAIALQLTVLNVMLGKLARHQIEKCAQDYLADRGKR